MLVRCNQCGRTYGEKSSESEGISSALCAKCYAVIYKDEMEDLKDILREKIVSEESGKVVWKGDEKVYSEEDLAFYNEVLAEVQGEIKEPHGEDRR